MSCNSTDLSEMRYLPDPGIIEIKRIITNGQWPMTGADEYFPWYLVSLPEYGDAERCVNSLGVMKADDIVPLY